jgi:hypothetical protein
MIKKILLSIRNLFLVKSLRSIGGSAKKVRLEIETSDLVLRSFSLAPKTQEEGSQMCNHWYLHKYVEKSIARITSPF